MHGIHASNYQRVFRVAVLSVLALSAARLAEALPLPLNEADATAKWETVVIPSLPVTDAAFAQQYAIVPLNPTLNLALSTGTALSSEALGGPLVRGFSEISGVAPNTHGGGDLAATSHARMITQYEVTGTGPVDLDIDVHIDGDLAGGNYFTDALGNVTSGVVFAALLHTEGGTTSLFMGDALLDVAATTSLSMLTTGGDWMPSNFTSFNPGDFNNQGRRIDITDQNENAAILNPGDKFAIELLLDTSVYAAGAFETAARSDFDSTGAISVSTDAPGGGFSQIAVPEPSTMATLLLGSLGGAIFWCRRYFDAMSSRAP